MSDVLALYLVMVGFSIEKEQADVRDVVQTAFDAMCLGNK